MVASAIVQTGAFESGFLLNTGNPEPFFTELKKHLNCSCKWCIFEYHNKKQYGVSPFPDF